jgi:hypothetical protein
MACRACAWGRRRLSTVQSVDELLSDGCGNIAAMNPGIVSELHAIHSRLVLHRSATLGIESQVSFEHGETVTSFEIVRPKSLRSGCGLWWKDFLNCVNIGFCQPDGTACFCCFSSALDHNSVTNRSDVG